MESTINGEILEESAEKENTVDKADENSDTASNLIDKNSNTLSLAKENSSIDLINSGTVIPPTEPLKQDNISVYENDAVIVAKMSDPNCINIIEELDSSGDMLVDFDPNLKKSSGTDDKDSLELVKSSNEELASSEDMIVESKHNSKESSETKDKVADSLELLENSIRKITSLLGKTNESEFNEEVSKKPNLSTTNSKVDLVTESITVPEDKGKSKEESNNLNEGTDIHVNKVSSDISNKDKENSTDSDNSILSAEKSNEQVYKNGTEPLLPSTVSSTNKDEETCKILEPLDLHSKVADSSQNSALPVEQQSDNLKSTENDVDMLDVSSSKSCTPNDIDNIADKTEFSKDGATSQERKKECDSFVFTELSNEETGYPEVFTGLVAIGKYLSVKGDFTLRSSEALVESASLIAPYLLKEPDTFPARAIPLKNDSRGFFYSTAGEFLLGIGLSRASEWYHRDMTRIKKRQMKKEGKNPQLEDDIKMHENFYAEAKKANRMYSFPLKSCKTCGFATESATTMEGHLLVPHLTSRREFQCNFCDVINRDPRALLEHMYRVHAKTGRIQPPNLFFECPYCTFESNSKVKLGNHLTKCQRFYDPNRNQAPPKDYEFPALTPKPITVAVVKAYEKSLSSMQRGRGRPKKMDGITDQMNQYASANQSPIAPNPIPSYRPSPTSALSESLSNLTNQLLPPMQMPNMSLRPPPLNSGMNQFRSGVSPMHLPSPNRLFNVMNSSAQMMSMMGNNSFVTSSSQFPFSPSLVSSGGKKLPTHTPNFINNFFNSGLRQQNSPKNSSEVTITPLPKLQGPYPVPHVKTSTPSNSVTTVTGNSLVVCEICDGYIKDLEQLRSHMQLIHKVKIHPKMLVSRPPLNCQKCQWRFFTDQGLERHLLGSHGLVTSNMQELANKSKDAGCCTICGRVYASKLVSHMNQVHKLTLKPAHLSYKCTVCSATFNLYRLFENHVYLVHSGAAKRSSDGSSNPGKKLKTSDMDNAYDGEANNHADKRTPGSGISRCKDCGKDFRKIAAQTERCEKCLGFDRQGLKGIMS